MGVVDRRVEQLRIFDDRIQKAQTPDEAYKLKCDKYQLEYSLYQGASEVYQVAKGWIFVPPPSCSA